MFAASPGYTDLVSIYNRETAENTIGLYLGAGINCPTETVEKQTYQTYGWEALLRALHQKNQHRLASTFDQLKAQYPDDWMALATAIRGSLSVDAFVQQLDEILYDDMPRNDRYARLTVKMLRQAPTLHAAICFSTQIRQRTQSTWTFVRNPKIATIITPNYDFFFGAGWTRYEAFKQQWNVTTFLSDPEDACEPGSINYIHGYLPYSAKQKHDIVLTTEGYQTAYHGGFAEKALKRGLSDYTLIFMGTSFDDMPLREMLLSVKRQHLAFVTENHRGRCEHLGVTPIIVTSYDQIAAMLEAAYCSALTEDELERVGIETVKDYWQCLKAGKTYDV